MDVLNALVVFANFVLLPAMTYGSQLALGALGATLVYGILRFSNFGHGDTMSFGTMATILAMWGIQAAGISIAPLPTALLALPAGMIATIAVVLLTDRLVYRPYRTRKVPSITLVMASLGVMFVMGGLVRILIGVEDRQFADGERFIFTAAQFRQWTGLTETMALRTAQAITLVTTIVVVSWLHWFLKRTRTGKSMRAFSDNENLALLSGINPERVVTIVWVLSAALATLAGVLYGLDKSFRPITYFQLLLPVFAAAVVGGLGNPIGAVAGGFVVAFSEILVTYSFKKLASYLLPTEWQPEGLLQLLSTDYKVAVSFIVLILVLLFRPTGIFRGKAA
ncbi:branched-chain amino acid ABC transporter permease [Mesorhizobium australicum]|uniref:Amino acid/amide ABC transporter membrane protein 1, HAAT family n=1 Tax=Mesorhizobium australicum TaxID=536018 RepID=A0A1X7PRT9_9HYPH|nr:branched-chain amino acid ABC transporter permease [Mesorhizobium australicum]SMH53844.1 amino acid/amide ABC transporter membrane protein 1, HAAT family [Mesorhizobium australicum]